MTIASEIGHYALISHMYVDEFIVRAHYVIKGFERLAREGGFITPNSLEAMQLEADAFLLRQQADELMRRRAALLANEPQPFKQAAE